MLLVLCNCTNTENHQAIYKEKKEMRNNWWARTHGNWESGWVTDCWRSPVIKRVCHSVKFKHPHTHTLITHITFKSLNLTSIEVLWFKYCLCQHLISNPLIRLNFLLSAAVNGFKLLGWITTNDLEPEKVTEGLAESAGSEAQRGPLVSVTSWQPPCQHGCESLWWHLKQKGVSAQFWPVLPGENVETE